MVKFNEIDGVKVWPAFGKVEEGLALRWQGTLSSASSFSDGSENLALLIDCTLLTEKVPCPVFVLLDSKELVDKLIHGLQVARDVTWPEVTQQKGTQQN